MFCINQAETNRDFTFFALEYYYYKIRANSLTRSQVLTNTSTLVGAISSFELGAELSLSKREYIYTHLLEKFIIYILIMFDFFMCLLRYILNFLIRYNWFHQVLGAFFL